jgi:ubiquinone/menaquinone biosynthesis C-methylase UbiE
MNESDKAFTGSIPALYDRYLGPLIFEPYAEDMAQRLAELKDGRLLEVAAGTGIVTRALDLTLSPEIKIVATDLNQAMLDHAMTLTKSSRVQWQQADALSLPFKEDEFDAVVCQFGVMFFPDKRKAFTEAWRALKPGGRYLFNVWDRVEENEVAFPVAEAVAACFPKDPPQFLQRTPYGYHDAALIHRELGAAGFTAIRSEAVTKRARCSSPRDPAMGFCQGSPLRSEIEARDPKRLEEVTDAAAKAVAAKFGKGAIDGKIQAIVFEAMK